MNVIDDEIVFIVDLNEVEDGDLLPVSMDYTVNAGPGVLSSRFPQPPVGTQVRAHSDDDDTIYYATVQRIVSGRDLIIRINWDTCTSVLNSEWSAKDVQWARASADVPATSAR
jgi:hypothetical protein